MDFSGRLGARRDVDEFGRERRGRPHHRKPYDRPGRGGHRGGHRGGGGAPGPVADGPQDIESRLSSLIIKVGDKNTPTLQNNLDALSVVLEKDYSKHEQTVLRTFRQCVLELPWKVTVYAALAGLLNVKNSETGGKVVGLMHAVLRRELAQGNWASVKVLMRFFALLVETNTISAESLLAMLDVFLAPTGGDVSARASCLAYIAMSTVLWAGRVLNERVPDAFQERLQTIENYVERFADATRDNTLTTALHDAPPQGANILAQLLQVLKAAGENGWVLDAIFLPFSLFTSEFAQAQQHELPELELPGPDKPGFTPSEVLQLVPCPAEHAVRRYVLQDFIWDTLAQLEGNRKDCARYLMQIHGLCNEDVCSVMAVAQHPEDVDPESALVFEYMVAEVLLSALLQLPEGPYREMYYASLAIELRKTEPQIMASVLETVTENAVARISSMDVECANRLSSWLAVYISNFGFRWDWAKWEGATGDDVAAPRRRFVEETLLRLIRLSYLDRVRAQLPEPCLGLVPAKAPSHNFKFTVQAMDERTREVSVAMGRCLKSKGTAEQALEILDTHYAGWTDVDASERQRLAREMLVSHVLLLGSKTFSHMLNAIERFMPALQQFGDTAEAKLEIARTTEDFWRKNSQFFMITIDKLVDYRIIDPLTVVRMLFDRSHVGQWCQFHLWEILRNAVGKVNMRVAQLQARRDAAAAIVEDEDEGDKQPHENIEQIEALLAQMTQEQKDVVVLTAQSFVQLLSSPDGTANEVDRAWLLGRFKEFMRTYRDQISHYAADLEASAFTADASPDALQVYQGIKALS
ncbi:Nuclear cap-binding protein subunit 1 [Coemansia sp. RSA 552]|nr:Nuclear cap-binding protein subunit 1 [Coemansia sp. RSA 552]